MINKKKIAELAKKIVQRRQGTLQDPRIMHPEREWLAGLGVAVGIFTTCTFWSVYSYTKNLDVTERINPTETTNEAVVYRESLVNSALSIFNERQSKFDALLGQEPAPVPEPEQTNEEITASTTTVVPAEENIENAEEVTSLGDSVE